MTYLLDVNVLIALIDPSHTAHELVHEWFSGVGSQSWATCPITQNGAIRIVSQPKYPGSMLSPGSAIEAVRRLRSHAGHHFWPDNISILNDDLVDAGRLTNPLQITDTYLLALAKQHGGMLATLDRRLVTDAVVDGRAYLHIISAPFQ